MCNYCNSATCGCGGSFWSSGYQRLCRDCCGNIRVANSGCGCQQNCGCGDTNGTDSNGNTAARSGFTYLTFCGNGLGTTNAANTASTSSCGCASSTANNYDWYYARQYGLLGYSGCPCGSSYTYDTVTQTT